MDELAWIREQAAVLAQQWLQLYLVSWSMNSWSATGSALWGFAMANSQALNHLAVVAAGIIGIPLLWIRTRAADRQSRTGEQGHITDRFTKAIEQLGSEKMAVRLGAIYALERLSKDSPDDHWTIMEVLTAYVRDNAPWPQALAHPFVELQVSGGDEAEGVTIHGQERKEEAERPEAKIRPATDIQAILTVLGRRDKEARKREVQGLNLERTDLRGAFLPRAKLQDAIFWKSSLQHARLDEANLQGAYLSLANLQHANLDKADLQGADISRANLQGAQLWRANLQGAYLSLANLQDARLGQANLQGALLAEANFQRAILWRANLKGATHVTQEQLNSAFGDDQTILPEGLTRPAHWLKSDPSPTTPPPSPPPPPEAPPDSPTHTSR